MVANSTTETSMSVGKATLFAQGHTYIVLKQYNSNLMKLSNLFLSAAIAAILAMSGCNTAMQGTASNNTTNDQVAVGAGEGAGTGMGDAEGSTEMEEAPINPGAEETLEANALAALNELNETMLGMEAELSDISLTGQIDEDFARVMAKHNRSSIKMADIILSNTTNLELQALMKGMMLKQQREVELLDEFARNFEASEDGNLDTEILLRPIEQASRELREMTPSGNINMDFAKMMLSHQKSGSELADIHLENGNNEALKDMTRQIKKDHDMDAHRIEVWMKNQD
jgi:uncharacterized protein (DUF305 family)